MAVVKVTLDQAVTRGSIDRAKVDAVSDEEIAQFNVEDGFDPVDTLKGFRRMFSPTEIRERTGLTQAEIAARLDIPLATWLSWEGGGAPAGSIDRAFLDLVADDPDRAFRIRTGSSAYNRVQVLG